MGSMTPRTTRVVLIVLVVARAYDEADAVMREELARARVCNASTASLFTKGRLANWIALAYHEAGRCAPCGARGWYDFKNRCAFVKFPRAWYDRVRAAASGAAARPRRRFVFIGASWLGDAKASAARGWAIAFARDHFSEHDYFALTDLKSNASGRATPWQRLGAFDHSATHAGVFPKAHKSGDPAKYAFDAAYYGLLGSADATLCPAGDMPWSMRFYEAIMARSIPVLRTRDDQYYSDAERALPFHVLYEQELRAAGGRVPFDASKADENLALFEKFHLLPIRPASWRAGL